MTPGRRQVSGAGSWGWALARWWARNGHAVRLSCREEDGPDLLRDERRSPHFLPGVLLPNSVDVSRDIEPSSEIAVLAVPSHAMRAVAEKQRFSPRTVLVNVAKGIENETMLCMHEVIEQAARPCTVVTLSGPSHAEEVANDLPASLVAAGSDLAACGRVQQAFGAATFRVYTSPTLRVWRWAAR